MNFKLPSINGTTVSLDNYPDAKGIVVVFTCNHCPYVIAYEQRIMDLQEKYADKGYPLIAISSNDVKRYPQDSFENMKERSQQKGFKFPYLYDETQEIAKDYGAERTPHAYLIAKGDDGEYQIKYKGAIDDNLENPSAVTQRFLEAAIDQFDQGEDIMVKETPPVGCTIKWKEEL
ncbi:MAG: thioredoxin family protein [Bacteroidetes bacterium]|nr:thioredoxin family protein [Bacteroidota bacterium]